MDPADYPPPAQRLPMLDTETYCDGKFCKLPGRIIPDHVQRTEITLNNGATSTFCRYCLTALNQPERGSTLFGNNTMYRNGFKLTEQS